MSQTLCAFLLFHRNSFETVTGVGPRTRNYSWSKTLRRLTTECRWRLTFLRKCLIYISLFLIGLDVKSWKIHISCDLLVIVVIVIVTKGKHLVSSRGKTQNVYN